MRKAQGLFYEFPQLGVNFRPITKCGATTMMLHLISLEEGMSTSSIVGDVSRNNIHKFLNPFAKKYQRSLTSVNDNNFKSFALVRNPYKRFISMYTDLVLKRPARGQKAKIPANCSIKDFAIWLKDLEPKKSDIHLQEQNVFLINGITEEKYVRDLITIDLDSMKENWPFEFKPPAFRAHVSATEKIELDDVTRNIVYQIYKKDFDLLGYEVV